MQQSAAIGNKAGAGAWFKAKMLGRLSSQEMGGEGKENNARRRDLDEESAAVVSQSHFHGYTVRCRWGLELEARVRKVLETCHNPDTPGEPFRNQMETLDMDAQRRELLFLQAHDSVLREQSLLSAWHQAAFPSNSQQLIIKIIITTIIRRTCHRGVVP
ncbi:uncharacterized protein LOC111865295 [Cryptotermes secundus]|uniref:uncharacterized protein LOC111865295 n=1 Tax=Cryptotermes secundus TaxID=105785 RepID=UPI000CD7D1C1|nr:uncharacterized protein LOC111865295 [Cryptotermes secundus]